MTTDRFVNLFDSFLFVFSWSSHNGFCSLALVFLSKEIGRGSDRQTDREIDRWIDREGGGGAGEREGGGAGGG